VPIDLVTRSKMSTPLGSSRAPSRIASPATTDHTGEIIVPMRDENRIEPVAVIEAFAARGFDREQPVRFRATRRERLLADRMLRRKPGQRADR
jgi:hypothetical protein